MTTTPDTSDVYLLVRRVVENMKAGPSREMFAALAELALADPDGVMPELFVEIEDAAAGLDLSTVVATDLLPDPWVTAAIANAVIGEDVNGLHLAVPGGYSALLPACVAAVVALELSR